MDTEALAAARKVIAQDRDVLVRSCSDASGAIDADAQPFLTEYDETLALIDAALASKPDAAPIDMVLHCPSCGMQHIDDIETVPDGDSNRDIVTWPNPPHRSHLCHGCGHIWRPADVPTNGVAAIKTKGKDDSPAVDPAGVEPRSFRSSAAPAGLASLRGIAAGALPAGMTSEDVIENSRADWSSAAPAGGAVEALRELVALKDMKERMASLSACGFVGHATCEGITFGPDFAECERLKGEYARRKPAAWSEAKRVVAALAAAPVVPPPDQYGDFDKLMSEHPPSEADRQRVRDALAALPMGASPAGSGSAASGPSPSVSALRAPIPGAGGSAS